MYQDKTIVCKDCGAEFVFTVRDQEFFAEKGFTNEPTRCKDCRSARKNGNSSNSRQTNREMYSAICSSCGKQAQVPFKPSEDKPVYCNDCFSRNNTRRR